MVSARDLMIHYPSQINSNKTFQQGLEAVLQEEVAADWWFPNTPRMV